MKNPTYREWPPCEDDEFTKLGEDMFVAYMRAVFWTALCAGVAFAAFGLMG